MGRWKAGDAKEEGVMGEGGERRTENGKGKVRKENERKTTRQPRSTSVVRVQL